MNSTMRTYRFVWLLTLMVAWAGCVCAQDTLQTKIPKAQLRRQLTATEFLDSLRADSVRRVAELQAQFDSIAQTNRPDSVPSVDGEPATELGDTLPASTLMLTLPTEQEVLGALKDQQFIPNPNKALWLAIVLPGGGQIYNRKYWKLPIIYGGLLGCVYALNWNNMMYRDYSQAYIDIMDSDPETKSYENFIPRGYDINRNLTRIQDMFRRKKNYYRRYRDLSLFAMLGVYALSIVDAYVDAELSSFDIGRDLSMKVSPSVIREGKDMAHRQPYPTQSYGVRCSVSF